MRFLIINERPDQRRAIIRHLQREFPGSAFVEVGRSEDMQAALDCTEFDVTLIGHPLTRIDGLSVLHAINHYRPDVPVIVITEAEPTAVTAALSGYVFTGNLDHVADGVKDSLEMTRRAQEATATNERLRISEERYRMIWELTSDYAYTFRHDPGDMLVPEWVTAAFPRAMRLTLEELEARGGWESLICPDDREAVQRHTERLRSGQPDVIEFRLVTKNGELRWVRNYVRPIWDAAQQRVVRLYGAAQDITERKRAEEARALSEDRFRSLVDAADDSIAVTDIDGNVLFINEAGRTLCGAADPSAVIGHNALEFLTEESQLATRQAIAVVRANGVARIGSNVLARLDGKRVPVETTATLLRNGRGAPAGFMAITRDMTERQRTEQRLRAQQAAGEALVTSATLAEAVAKIFPAIGEHLGCEVAEFWSVDRELDRLRCTHRWQMPGQAFPEFEAFAQQVTLPRRVGLPGYAWASGGPVWLADFAQHQATAPRAAIAVREGLHGALAFPIRLGPDVLAAMAFYSRAVCEPDPELLQILATIGVQIGQFIERERAQAALRHSEEQFRSLIENGSDIISIVNPNGFIRYQSPSSERLLGYRAADLVGRYALDFVHPEDVETLSRGFDAAAEGRQESIRVTFRFRHHDGAWRTLESVGSPLRNERDITGVVVNSRDITERTRAEEELASSRAQLRALSARLQSIREEERTRIAREIHDELGQVLTALKMDLDMLPKRLAEGGNGFSSEMRLQKFAAMSQLADSMIHSVQKIATELRPSLLDDLGLTAAIGWQARDFETRAGIRCAFTSPPCPIILDPPRSTALFRVLQEALTNVARHAHASCVSITLQHNADGVVLEVTDNGRGLSDTEANDPNALGLLGIRERAHLFGGEAIIQGAQGLGTTVRVRIPVAPPAREQA